ncbi:MAG: preprotein translocase subunit SecY [Chloroflexi bacterium]|nr:preprotein translocase subunit SecY [Chloroflexota bacterium]
MLEALRNAMRLPDLRNRILYTIGILVVFRLAAHVPVPGVNFQALRQFFDSNTLGGFLNLLSGGALANFSVVSLGVYPYITAQIIMQVITPIFPQLRELQKEGETGRKTLERYALYMTVPITILEGFGQASVLARAGALNNFGLSSDVLLPTITTIVTITAGTMFAMWLGELITEQGIGNGISIIIFGGIVAAYPQNVGNLLLAGNVGGLFFLAALMVLTVAAIVYIQEAYRRVPVQYGKRVRGTRVYGGQSTHIPLRVNSAGMIPLIFASSFLIFPGVIASYFVASANPAISGVASAVESAFSTTGVLYWVLYFILVVLFTYFYTDVVFKQQNLPETLQKQGGFIPGIRPGKPTEQYLNSIVQRITLVGAIFLGIIAVLPFFSSSSTTSNTLLFTSTGILIVVGVVLDTMKQLEAQLLMRRYEGFIK